MDQHPLNIDRLLATDDPVLEKCLHASNPAYLDKRFNDLKDQLDDIVKELKNPHVAKKLLWEEYRSKYHNGYSYTQFCYHISQHLSVYLIIFLKIQIYGFLQFKHGIYRLVISSAPFKVCE